MDRIYINRRPDEHRYPHDTTRRLIEILRAADHTFRSDRNTA